MNPRVSPASFLKLSGEVASFYGFHPVRSLSAALAEREKSSGTALVFYASAAPAHLPALHAQTGQAGAREQCPLRETGEFGMQVLGAHESLGEVLLLKTISAILGEWGVAVLRVRVNALGDRESQQRFSRELATYLRKHEAELGAQCREEIAKNPLAAYHCEGGACRAILADGPRPMNFLSEKSRAHFREVLEHLEHLGLPYELDDLLAGDARGAHLLFHIDLAEGDATVLAAAGGRFDEYIRRESGERDAAGVGASIFFRKAGASRASFTQMPNAKEPRVHFIQLGLRAKLKGLAVMDALRAARIPTSQSFDATQLAPQLLAARELGVAYILLMGQREALDGTVIVRSARNSAQETIALGNLPRFLKTLRV